MTNQGSVRLRFAYDYMSRRVEKEVETWTGMEWSNVVTIAFTYDGWNMIREARSDESKPNYYVWGLDLSGTLQGAGGVGGLLARVRQENIPHPLYYAYDANGNITDVLTNNGTLAAHYEYDPFGNTIAQSGDLADANPFRFSSKYWDAEVGVYYYGYRFYNPELGRWPNRDPIEEEGGKNLYGFALNRAVNTYDYLGLACCCKEINVQFNPGGDTFQWDVYHIHPNVVKIGNVITAQVTVEGNNPSDCRCWVVERASSALYRLNPRRHVRSVLNNLTVPFDCASGFRDRLGVTIPYWDSSFNGRYEFSVAGEQVYSCKGTDGVQINKGIRVHGVTTFTVSAPSVPTIP